MKKTNEIFADHMNEVIYVTADFMKKAGIWGTDEYDCFRAMKNENPEYKIVRRSVSGNKKVYKGLTIDRMRNFIELKEGVDSNAMNTFERVYAEAQVRGNAYPRVKSWFIHTYKDYADSPIWEAEENEQNVA